MEHLKHFVEVIDRSVETFRTIRESLIEQIDGDREGKTERKILYKCLMKLYTQGYLTAREYKTIANEEYGCYQILYMPLDDIVGWDLRREELRSF